MWGREAAIGTKQYWHIHHKVLRSGEWMFDEPYACAEEWFAKQEAEWMVGLKAHDGRHLYQEVTVSGPHIRWQEVWWKYRDENRGGNTRTEPEQ
jgi:hypothetical protein